MELDLTMKSKLWNQDPGVRCLEPNSMHTATDPDFVCPFNRDWDVELKTSSEGSDAIRGGGVSHPRKKATVCSIEVDGAHSRRGQRVQEVDATLLAARPIA